MPDDFRADRYTSGRLAIGGKTFGNLNFNGDRDWFKVSLVKGQKYQFDVIENNAMDAYLYLRSRYGSYITYDNNSGSNDDPRITYTATSTGTYFLDVGDIGNNNTGTYEIFAKAAKNNDDYSNDINTKGKIAIGGKGSGNLDFRTDRDWFKVNLIKGNTYQFDCISNSQIDPYLYLRDQSGNYLYFDDNSGNGNNARITYTANSTGNYFLDIGDIGDDNTGSYTLHAKSIVVNDDFSQDINTTGSITIGGKSSGKIETLSDRDWFLFKYIHLGTSLGRLLR